MFGWVEVDEADVGGVDVRGDDVGGFRVNRDDVGGVDVNGLGGNGVRWRYSRCFTPSLSRMAACSSAS